MVSSREWSEREMRDAVPNTGTSPTNPPAKSQKPASGRPQHLWHTQHVAGRSEARKRAALKGTQGGSSAAASTIDRWVSLRFTHPMKLPDKPAVTPDAAWCPPPTVGRHQTTAKAEPPIKPMGTDVGSRIRVFHGCRSSGLPLTARRLVGQTEDSTSSGAAARVVKQIEPPCCGEQGSVE